MHFWFDIALALAVIASQVMHHSKSKRLNELGDELDALKKTVAP